RHSRDSRAGGDVRTMMLSIESARRMPAPRLQPKHRFARARCPRCRNMDPRILRETLNGTGFAADYTAACYGLIPHKNGIAIELAAMTSGRRERASSAAGGLFVQLQPYVAAREFLPRELPA